MSRRDHITTRNILVIYITNNKETNLYLIFLKYIYEYCLEAELLFTEV